MGLKVIAEGIETEKQLNFLKVHRCDFAQGFY
ncbi:EAL domain-containing protein [Amphritea balenae]|uniref:EAL domain-containing protein n=1 Tax=Amphritea balenae TaxID=452629 RepID=A0A3P1SUZ5_9GAMM|nr:EAL domain-containing protein [Amphritea balenae]RRD01034.1 EAL domain-containing protein [Amphritea balenae]